MIRAAAALVTLSILGSSTVTAQTPSPQAPERIGAELRTSFDQKNVDAAVEALTLSGAVVYDDDGARVLRAPAGRRSGLKFLHAQARGMALQAATGGGMSAADLDALVPAIELRVHRIPVSAVVAAYVKHAPTTGAAISRRLMGDVDVAAHASLSFPGIVIALFVSDVLPAAPPAAAAVQPRLVHASWRHAAPDPCADVNEFIDSAGTRAVEAMRGAGAETSLLATVIASAANTIAGLAVDAVVGYVSETLGLSSARRALQVMNAVVSAVSLFQQWTLEITAEPATVQYVNHGTPSEGRFRARVEGGEGTSWPAPVRSCAALLNLELPGAATAPGSRLQWWTTSFAPHVTEVRRDQQLREDSTGSLEFRAASEAANLHAAGGANRSTTVQVMASVSNTMRANMLNAFLKLNLVIGPLLGTSAQLSVFTRLMDPVATGRATVMYHQPRSATSSFTRGGVTLRAYTCDGIEWNYTVDHVTGSTRGTFTVPGSYSWATGFVKAAGTVSRSGDTLVFRGATAAPGAGTSDGFAAPIVYGPVAECVAR